MLFALLIVASSFITIINLEQIKNTKEQLRNINLLVSELNDVTDISRNDYEELKALNNTKINGIDVRFTLIDDNGVVLYDNEQKSSENHRIEKKLRKQWKLVKGIQRGTVRQLSQT